MKNMAKRAKQPSKSGDLGAKNKFWGHKKIRADNQTRKAKWCKMQAAFLKMD